MNQRLALYLAVPVVALVVGIAAGSYWNRPAETQVMPPFSVKNFRSGALDSFCVNSKAFSDLSLATQAEHKPLGRFNVQATALSDRGVICVVSGPLFTKRRPADAATVTTEPFKATILVSVTGESEIVTNEFAQALASSPTVAAMASNIGNDGTVIEKVKINLGAEARK